MAEIPADVSAMHSEDRERLNLLLAVPDSSEGHRRANPQLKSILDELTRHPKPEVDDGPKPASERK